MVGLRRRAPDREYGRECNALFQEARSKFSAETTLLLQYAEAESRSRDDDHVGTEHLVLALYALPDTAARRALESLGITKDTFANQLECEPGPSPKSQIPLTPRSQMIIGLAGAQAKQSASPEIQPDHVLLGVIQESEKWEAAGMAGPHHLRAAARAAGATLNDIKHKLLQAMQ